MSAITVALQQLRQILSGEFPDEPGVQRFCVMLAEDEQNDALAWLDGQSQYPQFYWRHRNGQEERAALGAVIHCDSFAEAQQFCLEHRQRADIRLYGLNAFDLHSAALFLPRLEWCHSASGISLCLNLFSPHSLKEDALSALAFLAKLAPAGSLTALSGELLSEEQHPQWPEWERLIGLATRAIGQGSLDKVVLARATDLTFQSGISAPSLMAASRLVNVNCYHFLMRFSADSAFLGSSPERLWQRIDTRLRTEALAGTVAHADVPDQRAAAGEWLLNDEKNQRENGLVVEDICQRLQKDVVGLDVFPQQLIHLRNIQHLKRAIQGTLKKPDDLRCLQQLQPTAAVAGLPREAARDFIQAHEPFDREWYAGSAGYLSHHRSEFCVALRSAKISQQRVRLYAGAGIVEGSVAELEWQEINNKAAGLRRLLTDN